MGGSPVRGCTKPSGDPITVRSFLHALHHPLTTFLHSLPRSLVQLNSHRRSSRHRRHLPHRQCLSAQPHYLLPVISDHLLHLLPMTSLQRLRRRVPPHRVFLLPGQNAAVPVFFLQHFLLCILSRKEDLWEESGSEKPNTAVVNLWCCLVWEWWWENCFIEKRTKQKRLWYFRLDLLKGWRFV